MNKKLCIVHCALCIAFSGCLLGPNYTRPEVPVPVSWQGDALATDTTELARWWERFDNLHLTNLILRAFENNLDLLQAAERVRQARAVLVQTGGNLQTLDASGGASRRYNSNTGWSSLYSAGFDAAWELDIFGGNRRAVEAAEADLRASEAARRGMRVTLATEVANAYYTWVMQDSILYYTKQNVELLEHSARITRDRHAAGWVSALDVANAEGQLNATRAQIPLVEAEMRSCILALELLLAQLPGTLGDLKKPPAELSYWETPFMPETLPSELLQRRPDIQRAEAQLAAATARIGVAEADRFPKFRLFAGVGLNANVLNDWSRTLSLGPGISAPIFNAGRLRARVEEREAFAQEKLLAYRQTVLAAFSEVEDAWQSLQRECERSTPLAHAKAHYQYALHIANGLYESGEADYTDVLLAQRAYISSLDTLIRHHNTITKRHIALYKALGGGWEEEGEENP